MSLFDALGFCWESAAIPQRTPTYSKERVCFRLHRMLAEFVWDASVLEGNSFTYPEVQTLLEGISVGGHTLSDQEQVLNLVDSTKSLLALVKRGEFVLNKSTFCALHARFARNQAPEWGHFRGEGAETGYTPDVGLGAAGRYTVAPTLPDAPDLNRAFTDGLAALDTLPSPFEKGLAFFLFGARQQFFFDANKRTARFMMNGILMSAGIDAISIPASRMHEFNEKMARFYQTKEATEMMAFLVACHPDADAIRVMN